MLVSSCRACGTLYARHGDESERGGDYNSYYHPGSPCVPDFVERRHDEIADGFASYRQTGRLLDVGCGAGSLLRAARRGGWDAEGTEVSRPAVEHARSEGFTVFSGELAEAGYTEASFDVVTAIEVLEHVPDPRALLSEIRRVLRPGGLFWGTTPHGRGMSARLLGLRWSVVCPPEHLQLFSLAGLRQLLRAADFGRARLVSRGINPSELLHVLWGARAARGVVEGQADFTGAERVRAAYRLNEAATKNTATRLSKATINALLGAARLGDSIRISAEK
ncbi:MAG: class I SAM-dependent methyltransferase [Pyrinomonadaceae bacterium]